MNGLVQDANAPESTLHVTVPSDTVKANDGVVRFVGPVGPDVIVTVGAVVSTVNDRDAVPMLPAASVALTVTV